MQDLNTFVRTTTEGTELFNRNPHFKQLYLAASDDEITYFFDNLYGLQRKEVLLSWLENHGDPIDDLDYTEEKNLREYFDNITRKMNHDASTSITIFQLHTILYELNKAIDDRIVFSIQNNWDDISYLWDTDIRRLSVAEIIQEVENVENDEILTSKAWERGLPVSSTIDELISFIFELDAVKDADGNPDPNVSYFTVIPDDFGHPDIYVNTEAEADLLTQFLDSGECGITHNLFSENPSYDELYEF